MLSRITRSWRKWREDFRRRRTERLTARSAELSASTYHDLFFLQQKGFVRAKATGQSITQIHAELESLVNRTLRVVIQPGTYFVSHDSHQNMVARQPVRVTLAAGSRSRIAIDAACINAARAIPNSQASFSGVSRTSDDIARFLEAAGGADAMVVQTGVWALTDAYTADQIKRHLLSRDRLGNVREVVTDAHVRQARQILDDLRIRHHL
jgi:hypothetical protein